MSKRILCILLCGMLLFVGAVTGSAKGWTWVLGDANGDGLCTAIDFVMIKRHVMRTYQIDDLYLQNADINKDGRLNAADYVLAKRIVMMTYTPPAAEGPQPDEKTTAVLTLNLLLKNGTEEDLVLLEGIFDISVEEMNTLVVDYMTNLSVDGKALSQWEGSIVIRQEDLEKLASSLREILLQIRAEQKQ